MSSSCKLDKHYPQNLWGYNEQLPNDLYRISIEETIRRNTKL